MTPVDEGGESACWVHLVDAPLPDIGGRVHVERFVRDFYRQAAMDDVLGPVFAAAGMNWNRHIETLVEFWSWQLFGVRGYEGNPLRAHEPAHARTPFTAEHYERWLELFEATIDTSFAGPISELAKARARKMAAAMRRLLDGVSDPGDAAIEPTWTRSPGVG